MKLTNHAIIEQLNSEANDLNRRAQKNGRNADDMQVLALLALERRLAWIGEMFAGEKVRKE